MSQILTADSAGTRPPDEEAPHHRIHAPLLAINSEAFTYWPSNFKLVQSLIDETESEPKPSPSWMLTVRGSVHVTQSDFSLLYPHICSLFLKQVVDPQRALDLNINASLEFLSHVMPAKISQINRAYENEGLLESDLSPLDEIPAAQLHRPKERYTAARLRIKHEWFYRLNPGLAQKVKRKVTAQDGVPEETGDEIWLHQKPAPETLDAHLRRTDLYGSQQERHQIAGLTRQRSQQSESDSQATNKAPSDRKASQTATDPQASTSSSTTLSRDP